VCRTNWRCARRAAAVGHQAHQGLHLTRECVLSSGSTATRVDLQRACGTASRRHLIGNKIGLVRYDSGLRVGLIPSANAPTVSARQYQQLCCRATGGQYLAAALPVSSACVPAFSSRCCRVWSRGPVCRWAEHRAYGQTRENHRARTRKACYESHGESGPRPGAMASTRPVIDYTGSRSITTSVRKPVRRTRQLRRRLIRGAR